MPSMFLSEPALDDEISKRETIHVLPANLTRPLTRTATVASQSFGLFFRDPRRAVLIFRMANWLVFFTLLMKFLPMHRALQIISAPVRTRSGDVGEKELASALDTLLAADLFIFRPSCWKRAAILHRYLALEGIESRINFGMRKDDDGGMSGHAWLERSGQAILESTPPDYTITYSFPS